MSHNIDVTIKEQSDIAGFTIPHNLRELLMLGGADELRDDIKGLIVAWVDKAIDEYFKAERAELQQRVNAKRQELMDAFAKIVDID